MVSLLEGTPLEVLERSTGKELITLGTVQSF